MMKRYKTFYTLFFLTESSYLSGFHLVCYIVFDAFNQIFRKISFLQHVGFCSKHIGCTSNK